MRNHTPHIIFLLIVVLFLHSCKDDDQVKIADVEILAPGMFSEYNVLDTIFLKVVVESSETFADVAVKLNTSEGIPVLPAKIVNNVATGTETEIQYIINDSTVPGDVYTLNVSLINQNMSYGRGVQVYINEIPLKLKGVCIVSRKNDSEVEINMLNTDFEIEKSFTKPGDYAGSAINSKHQQLIIAGAHAGDVVSYSTKSFKEMWRVEGITNPVQPYFTFLNQHESIVYAGFWEGFIQGYNHDGNTIYSSEMQENAIYDFMLHFEEFLVSAVSQKSQIAQKWIHTNYNEGGMLVKRTAVNFVPVGFSSLPNSRVLIFANDSTQKMITWLYEPPSGLLTKPYEPFYLPGSKLLACRQISKEVTLFATENEVMLYDFEDPLMPLFEFDDTEILQFESLNNLIWLGKHQMVYAMYMDGTIIKTLSFNSEILNIHFLYNK